MENKDKKPRRRLKKDKTPQESAPIKDVIDAKEYMSLPDEEKKYWSPIPPKYERVSKIAIVGYIIAAICGLIYLIAALSPRFADFFNKYVASFFRFILAKITGILPFSLAECILILSPLILTLIAIYVARKRCQSWRTTGIAIVNILSVFSILISTFCLTLGTGYRTSTLDKRLELQKSPVSANDLYNTAMYLSDMANKELDNIRFDEERFSVMPYGFDEMNRHLLDAYDKFSEKYTVADNFDSRLKPVMFSKVMSYTHVTGVYSFFTGEANLNVDFPDYTIPFTAAHELAHQRGIARENEANMIAFLVCIGSDDLYIRYSAYVNMYEYVANALYSADRGLYSKAAANLDFSIRSEQVAYNEFFMQYAHSVSSKVSGAVNDTYLKSQGTEGQVSYGMVVDLTVAYLKSEGKIN